MSKEDSEAVASVVPLKHVALIDYSGGNQSPATVSRGILISTAGNLKIDTAGGESGVIVPFTAGWHPVQVTKIYQASSTAAGSVWW